MITPKELIKLAYEIETERGICSKKDLKENELIGESWQIAKNVFSIVYNGYHVSYNEEKICIYTSSCKNILCENNEWKENYAENKDRLKFDSWDDAISYINENKVELQNNLKSAKR